MIVTQAAIDALLERPPEGWTVTRTANGASVSCGLDMRLRLRLGKRLSQSGLHVSEMTLTGAPEVWLETVQQLREALAAVPHMLSYVTRCVESHQATGSKPAALL